MATLRPKLRWTGVILLPLFLAACGGGGSGGGDGTAVTDPVAGTPAPAPTALDLTLAQLTADLGLTGDPTTGRVLPDATNPLVELGKKLFFSKSLGGGFDAACVSCHHPALGGSDGLSLPVGVAAIDPDLLGIGREHGSGAPPIPRNSPSVFNIALFDSGLFLDSRVESLSKTRGQNGGDAFIRTPDTSFGVADAEAGSNLPQAQARFPVTSDAEMRTAEFQSGVSGDAVRDHLAARLGGYGAAANELVVNEWLGEFQTAFVSADSAERLITFDNIATAIAEYERSMVFVNNPWKAYLDGDLLAISDVAKRGAVLFFTTANRGGAGCSVCHSGDFFTDERHHNIAFPQIGPGKGDGNSGTNDFGRERETGLTTDRFGFRTPTLLNVAVTAPYTHAGAYSTLAQVVRHYRGPRGAIDDYFGASEWCDLPQFEAVPDCANLYPDAAENTRLALTTLEAQQRAGLSLLPNINLNNTEVEELIAFLRTLTDPCVEDRACLATWIADAGSTGPDGQQLNAHDINGQPL